MIGGMVSSTILTLIVIPAVYALIKERGLRRQRISAAPAAFATSGESAP
jgi:Cu(I)/Ag(I) efflux system membrane protein CusA/SilA